MKYSYAIVYTFFFIVLLSACNGSSPQNADLQKAETPIAQLNEAIKNSPENADLYFKRAQIFHQSETYLDAIADLSKAVELDSNQFEYYHLLADVYLDSYKSFDALRVMKSTVERFPDNTSSYLKLAEFQHILKKHRDVFETVDKVLKKDPQNAEAYFMMGLSLKEINETNRAINSFQSAVENNPQLIDAWIILGQMYTELGDPLALKYFDNALLIEPNNLDVMHAKAYYLNEQKDTDGALAMYKEMISKDPKYKEAYLNLGLIYLEMDSLKRAISNFDILLEVAPLTIAGYYYRGLTKELAGDMVGAKSDFKQALKFSPNYAKAQEGLQRVEGEM